MTLLPEAICYCLQTRKYCLVEYGVVLACGRRLAIRGLNYDHKQELQVFVA